ncbi:MAG: rod shape-determining protein MreD [Endomicrobium sp.]|jgi:rod shape-determining protein MreD|nr:rod shape-determining protein MreD [Endomicrobium sp.]
MRKIIFYNVLCLLQFFFSKYISIYKISPNFVLVAIIYIGLSRGIIYAEIMGFLLGLTWDAFSSEVFGMKAMMFTIVGYFSGKIHKKFDHRKIFTQFVVISCASIIYCLGTNLFYFILMNNFNHVFFLTRLDLVNILATVFVAPPLFYILDRVGL